MPMRPITYDGAQHIGKRSEQQDFWGVLPSSDPGCDFVAVLADGMGGMSCGEEAARIAAEAFLAAYSEKEFEESIPDALNRSIYAANDAVKEMASDKAEVGEVGTTLVAAVTRDGVLYWASVGDSRIYLANDRSIRRLNVEHNLKTKLMHLVAQGHMDEEDVESNPQKDALTSYIGIETLKDVDISEEGMKMASGDRVILCSDGLYKTLADSEILDCATSSQDGTSVAAELVDAVLKKDVRHQDNVTVVSLAFGVSEEEDGVAAHTQIAHRKLSGRFLATALFLVPCAVALFWLIKNIGK